MTTVKGKLASNINSVEGYLGIASELVGYDQKYAGIMRQLLGRILIVENLDNGMKLARANGQRYRIITLDGDVISPGGAMSGGAFKKEKGQLLSRRNELETLGKEIESTGIKVNELEEKNISFEDTILTLKEEIETIRVKEQDINIELHTITTMLNSDIHEMEKFNQELNNITTELKQTSGENQKLDTEKMRLDDVLDNTETDHTDAEEKVSELNEFIQVLKEDRSIVTEELTTDKMTLSSMIQQMEHMDENILRLGEALQNKTETISSIREEISQIELMNLREMQDLSKSQENQINAKGVLAKLNETLGDLRYKRQEIQVSKGQLDSKKEIAHDEANQLEKEMIRITNNIEKLEILKETQINYMWDEYELTYTTALEYKADTDMSENALKQRIGKLKSEMKQLGDVNVHAIEEFRQVKERFTFLSTQRDDLEIAKEKLLEIIGDWIGR